MQKEGFTLAELAMVIVIIAILVSIIAPNFSGQSMAAKEVKTRANLEKLRNAIELYRMREGEWPHVGTYAFHQLTGVQPSPSGATYLTQIPKDGFLDKDVIVNISTCPQLFAPGPGGWCWDFDDHIVYPNLDDNNPTYNNLVFSSW